MKIMVNYDLMERIKDSNEDFKFRIIRKRFKQTAYYYPFWFLTYIAISGGTDSYFKGATASAAVYLGITLTADLLTNQIFGDVDRQKAINDLRKLSRLLSNIHINTSSELLQKAEEYQKKHTIKLNENKLPYIFQEKYIMVPTYNDGKIKDVSLLQEHVIGTNKYVLSTGSPSKVYKLALAGH